MTPLGGVQAHRDARVAHHRSPSEPGPRVAAVLVLHHDDFLALAIGARAVSPRHTSVHPEIRSKGRSDQFDDTGSVAGKAITENVLPMPVM